MAPLGSPHTAVISSIEALSAFTQKGQLPTTLNGEALKLVSLITEALPHQCSLITIRGRSLNALIRDEGAAYVANKALVLVEGQVNLEDVRGLRALPLGYTCFDISRLIRPEDNNIQVDSGSVRFLLVPRDKLKSFLQTSEEGRSLVTSLIQRAHPVQPMAPLAVQTIQTARDQNVHALVLREVIEAVTRRGGIFDILNPTHTEVQSAVESRDLTTPIGAEELKWAIVKTSSAVAAYLRLENLREIAEEARRTANSLGQEYAFDEPDKAGLAIHLYRLLLRTQEKKFIEETFPALRTQLSKFGWSDQDQSIVVGRLLQVAWLLQKINGDQHHARLLDVPLRRILEEVADTTTRSSAEDHFAETIRRLDQHLERLFEEAKERNVPGILSVSFTKYPSEIALDNARQHLLESSHPIRGALHDLTDRLSRGEKSAVGGEQYALARFPREMLDKIASGQTEVVLYNGSKRFGLLYVRQKYGVNQSDPSILEPCTVMELQGYYGSFSRSWVFFKDGKSVVLISHVGESRQLSNAAALLLYKDATDNRPTQTNIHLISDTESAQVKVERSIKKILRQSEEAIRNEEVLGVRVDDPENLPTLGIFLLYPKQLSEAFLQQTQTETYRSKTLGEVQVVYMKHGSQLVRCILPRVGSSGLYGDTAGYFVDALLNQAIVKNPIPHILFSATAGGLNGTALLPEFTQAGVKGIPNGSPSGYLAPRKAVIEDDQSIPLSTLFESEHSLLDAQIEALNTACDKAGVLHYDRHCSVSCPALETFPYIDTAVKKHQVSSIDVEGGPISRAVHAARSRGLDATFTPIYRFSDDPRDGRDDLHRTLAIGGVLVDNAGADPAFVPVIKSLADLAIARWQRTRR